MIFSQGLTITTRLLFGHGMQQLDVEPQHLGQGLNPGAAAVKAVNLNH